MKNKKTMITVISIVALLLLLIGITYAYWLVTKTQTNSNIISSACLDITLDNEANDISLSSQYPMSDEEGMQLTPYTFTITNNCNTSVDYQVALEATGDESTSIASSAIKVALDNNAKVYSSYSKVAATISGAYESRSIGYARLAAAGNEGSSATHSVRIWIDENAPISEMNKTFASKISVTVGQGIDSPYATGTLAYDILANYGGVNSISEIDATEKADRITAEENVSVGTSGNYYYGTEYTLNESTGTYTLSGTVVQAKLSECRDGTKTCGEYTTKSTSTSSTTLYEITDFQTSGSYVTAYTRKYTTAFAVATTSNDAGLYKAQDDLGTAYYYRGAVTNNYVQFGAIPVGTQVGTQEMEGIFYYYNYNIDESEELYTDGPFATETDCENYSVTSLYSGSCEQSSEWETMIVPVYSTEPVPMYWRIVRINGDGTIRLIYDGTKTVLNGIVHTSNIGNGSYGGVVYSEGEGETEVNEAFYNPYNVDYGHSVIQQTLDKWYSVNLKTNYESYIADGIFCNDKEVTKAYYYDEGGNETDSENAAVIESFYTSSVRLDVNRKPQLTCARKEDRYTKDATLGNALLTNPVGLLTSDEAVFAGGSPIHDINNNNYYLFNGESFWTLTAYGPSELPGTGARLWVVLAGGNVNTYGSATDDYAIRPVINLRATVEFTGDGSYETPYVIKTN